MKDQRLGGSYGTLADFWQWAFSDLRANNIRGIFAEWVVAQLLQIQSSARDSWADHDLVLPDGRKIEVKASAHVQAWHSESSKPSKIMFGGLRSHKWHAQTANYEMNERTYNADIYIFCVQTEKAHDKWQALDLAQWEFYVVPARRLAEYGFRSISLSKLRTITGSIPASQLRQVVDNCH